MAPDEFQTAWQAEETQQRLAIDAELLHREVDRNQRDFRATIVRRDCVEIGVALLLLPVWIYLGIAGSEPWTWYLMIPALIWVAGYLLVFRIRKQPPPRATDEPLLNCVQRAVSEVEDQIWLLRNILWWYLFPLGIPLLAYLVHLSWLRSTDWMEVVAGLNVALLFFCLAIFGLMYFMNRRSVNVDLLPRRRELDSLLAGLEDGVVNELPGRYSQQIVESHRVRRCVIFLVFWCLTAIAIAMAGGLFDSEYQNPPQRTGPNGDRLARHVSRLRTENNLVGLAAMVMIGGKVDAAAAHGERKHGSGIAVEIGDRWHLGGITKSITATMIGRLVESGQMQWMDTVGDAFPDADIDQQWKSVTVRQLLTHTAGAPANFSLAVRRLRPGQGLAGSQARRVAVLNVLAKPPALPPGSKYAYSNVGLTIAGAIAEAATGTTWEDLVRRAVFEPLELEGAGFGPPGSSANEIEQPQGHRTFLRGKVAVGDKADNTPIMGPAATVHMTLKDLCDFATEHMRGAAGDGKLLSLETYEQLHSAEIGFYACGWVVQEPNDEIPYQVYWHNGSNTMWYALVAFIPEKQLVVAVTSNDDDFENAEAAAWEIVEEVARE